MSPRLWAGISVIEGVVVLEFLRARWGHIHGVSRWWQANSACVASYMRVASPDEDPLFRHVLPHTLADTGEAHRLGESNIEREARALAASPLFGVARLGRQSCEVASTLPNCRG